MSHTWGEWTLGMMDVPQSTASVSRTSTAFNCSSSSVKYIYIHHALLLRECWKPTTKGMLESQDRTTKGMLEHQANIIANVQTHNVSKYIHTFRRTLTLDCIFSYSLQSVRENKISQRPK